MVWSDAATLMAPRRLHRLYWRGSVTFASRNFAEVLAALAEHLSGYEQTPGNDEVLLDVLTVFNASGAVLLPARLRCDITSRHRTVLRGGLRIYQQPLTRVDLGARSVVIDPVSPRWTALHKCPDGALRPGDRVPIIGWAGVTGPDGAAPTPADALLSLWRAARPRPQRPAERAALLTALEELTGKLPRPLSLSPGSAAADALLDAVS